MPLVALVWRSARGRRFRFRRRWVSAVAAAALGAAHSSFAFLLLRGTIDRMDNQGGAADRARPPNYSNQPRTAFHTRCQFAEGIYLIGAKQDVDHPADHHSPGKASRLAYAQRLQMC